MSEFLLLNMLGATLNLELALTGTRMISNLKFSPFSGIIYIENKRRKG